MNCKSLSSICAGVILAMNAIPAFAESNLSSRTIFCENSNGMLTTMAKTVEGKSFPIFHWQSESLPKSSSNLQQLCNSVSTKLDKYLAQGSVLSSFGSYEQLGLPTVCAETNPGNCSLVLFTLAPTDNPINQSNKVLEDILDDNLKQKRQVSNIRGVQAYAFNITGADFFKLLLRAF